MTSRSRRARNVPGGPQVIATWRTVDGSHAGGNAHIEQTPMQRATRMQCNDVRGLRHMGIYTRRQHIADMCAHWQAAAPRKCTRFLNQMRITLECAQRGKLPLEADGATEMCLARAPVDDRTPRSLLQSRAECLYLMPFATGNIPFESMGPRTLHLWRDCLHRLDVTPPIDGKPGTQKIVQRARVPCE